MKFALATPGLILYPPVVSEWERTASAGDVLGVARTADRAGWDWLTVPEHLVMPTAMAEIMGPRFPEAITAAAVIAGATERISLLTYALVLPYRNPVLVAKQIATLDFLSGGRIAVGVAVGHLEREFEILEVPFSERGARVDESIKAILELWTSNAPSFQGKFVSFEDVVFEPKPVQKPHPPIFVGGNSRAALRRAARLGDGWLPWLVTAEQLPESLDYLSAQPGFEARREGFEVVMPLSVLNVGEDHRERGDSHLLSGRAEIVDEIAKLREAGATAIQVVPPKTGSAEELSNFVEWFARDVIPEFRA